MKEWFAMKYEHFEGTVEELVLLKIREIEEKEHVRILHAVESGSRAWGFASPDSDYDVRFIYARDKNYYLRLRNTRDYIDGELNEVLDMNGWERKPCSIFINLMRRCLNGAGRRWYIIQPMNGKICTAGSRIDIFLVNQRCTTIMARRIRIIMSICRGTWFGIRNISMCCALFLRANG